MSRSLVLRRAARREFDDAIDWYDQQQSGLGEEFESEVQRSLETILNMPMMFAIVHRDLREAWVRRFPYGIYYRVEPGRIVVVAIVHTSRDPSIWQGRT